MYLIRSGAIEGFEQLVRSLGANPITLISEAGLAQSQFRQPNAYVSYRKIAELMELAAEHCNESLLGLRLASQQSSAVLGDLSLTLSQQPTLGDALQNVNRYLYLHANGAKVEQHSVGDDTRVEIKIEIDSPMGMSQMLQISVGQLANFFIESLALTEPGFAILLRQTAPAGTDTPVHVGTFPRIHFGASVNGIQFPRRWLKRSLHRDEKVFQRHFQENLQDLQRRYPNKLTHQVRNVIGSLLPTGDCSLERVAATLGLHPRVLQKRLKKQGTSYNQLLQEIRLVIAQQHLRHQSASITDLALNLGYSDISVFSRHFKSWTGMSPRNWQAADVSRPN